MTITDKPIEVSALAHFIGPITPLTLVKPGDPNHEVFPCAICEEKLEKLFESPLCSSDKVCGECFDRIQEEICGGAEYRTVSQ